MSASSKMVHCGTWSRAALMLCAMARRGPRSGSGLPGGSLTFGGPGALRRARRPGGGAHVIGDDAVVPTGSGGSPRVHAELLGERAHRRRGLGLSRLAAPAAAGDVGVFQHGLVAGHHLADHGAGVLALASPASSAGPDRGFSAVHRAPAPGRTAPPRCRCPPAASGSAGWCRPARGSSRCGRCRAPAPRRRPWRSPRTASAGRP
jgi:hypothetical protein